MSKKRGSIIFEFIKAKNEMEKENARKERAAIKRAEFEATFPRILKEAKVTVKDWREVKHFWIDAAKKRGWIPEMPKEESLKIWDQAQKVANKELQLEIDKFYLLGKTDTEKQRAIIIAQKMAFFQFCLQNPDWKPK